MREIAGVRVKKCARDCTSRPSNALSRVSETFLVDNLARVEQSYKMVVICNGN